MIYFEGDDAINLEQVTLNLVQERLVAQLALQPHRSTFNKWNGAPVTQDDTRAAAYWNGKKPFIFLSIQGGDHEFKPWRDASSGTWRYGTKHLITATAEIISSDFSGHKIGASNPVSVTRLLRDALQHIVDTSKVAFNEVGLYFSSIKPDAARRQDPNLFNPHSISFEAYTLKPAV